MADDQNTKPKTMDINDLVRELSKSSTSSAAPTPTPAPQTQAPRPFFPTPPSTSSQPSQGFGGQAGPSAKPPMPPPIASSPPKFNVPPPSFSKPVQSPATPTKPTPASPVPPSFPSPGVKEYQSSIRTMNEDISKLRQGQKPTGIDVPRKVEQIVPPPQATPPKPAMPSQQFKVPSVNLGEAQKTGPIDQPKDFSRPGPVVPRFVPVVPKTESNPQIYVPPEGQPGGNRNMLFVGIGAVAVVAGFSYWFFVLRSPTPEVVIETPTPTLTPTPIQDLSTIFSGLLEVSTETAYGDHQLTDKKGEFVRLRDPQNQDVLGRILNWLNPPQSVKDNLGNDSLALLFVQSEFFDTKGQIKISGLERRPVLIVEARDAYLLTQATSGWEATIVEATSNFWNIDKSKQASIAFLDNMYKGEGIRYKNFPYSDRTIDYSVVSASNGKTYFVIANSREATYAAIDKLKGF